MPLGGGGALDLRRKLREVDRGLRGSFVSTETNVDPLENHALQSLENLCS